MLTPCVGRERVLAHVREALDRSRWVSVVGPPGCGKTLVMRHVAATRAGVVWVSCAGRTSAAEVWDACLDALDETPTPGETRAKALRHALDGTGRLLVIDDVPEGEELAEELGRLLDLTTDLHVAVTSSSPLGGVEEFAVRVPPLPLPRPDEPLGGPCLQLLQNRVRAAGGHRVDTTAHAVKLRTLLEATGGLPLLLEQVAAQVALVGPESVLPPTSVAEAVDSAYQVLTEPQRRCLRRYALMDEPASLEVLAAVTGLAREEAGAAAATLVRRSLLELLPDGRFDLLTPIRARARELAGGEDLTVVRSGLLAWADRVAPREHNVGAGDAPWLKDLPSMRAAIRAACESPPTRDLGYAMANRIFSSLYTSMRSRDAVEILELVLTSGDGPGSIGAQVARRAGIAASEVRGTYEGLWLLDRADEHAPRADDPALETARTAAIRAEMHLDAGDLDQAALEARRAVGLHSLIARQAHRTLVDVLVSRGDLGDAATLASEVIPLTEDSEERWINLSTRTLLGRVALEQGRLVEAAAAARTAAHEARGLAEDRVCLLAQTLLRQVDPSAPVSTADRSSLPWAVRLPVLTQDARDLLDAGDPAHAAGLAADVVVLADSGCLGRDAVEARLLLGHALLAQDDPVQAASTFLAALERAAAMPMPLRVADALDGIAVSLERTGDSRAGRTLAATAAELRRPRHAVPWGLAAAHRCTPGRSVPASWLQGHQLARTALPDIAALVAGTATQAPDQLGALTRAERQVADRVADGLTSRQIAEEFFISPRTVDTHLTHIYRKLGISGRARLAALVADLR